MAFPTNWPPPKHPTERFTLRFFKSGTGTALFSDNAWIFADFVTAIDPLPVVKPGGVLASGALPTDGPLTVVPTVPGGTIEQFIFCTGIRICNDGAANLNYSFDGATIHGTLKPNEVAIYWPRHEAGVALSGITAFRIEAW